MASRPLRGASSAHRDPPQRSPFRPDPETEQAPRLCPGDVPSTRPWCHSSSIRVCTRVCAARYARCKLGKVDRDKVNAVRAGMIEELDECDLALYVCQVADAVLAERIGNECPPTGFHEVLYGCLGVLPS